MARKVFFSFHYSRDAWRVGQVRNSNVIAGYDKSPFYDKATWQSIKQRGEQAIRNWIEEQLKGTSVTIVLIGSETATHPWVKYEIERSVAFGKGLIGIDISKMKDQHGNTNETGSNPLPAGYNEMRLQIEDLYSTRQVVTSSIHQRREELKTDLQNETKTSKQLNHTLELKLGFDSEVHKETPAPEFTEKELDQLEANARFLRDPKLLQTVYQHFERHYGITTRGIQTITTRLGETLEFAKASLADVNDRIRTFSENRESFPVLFKGTNGEEQTATVSELNKQAVGRNIFARILDDSVSSLSMSRRH